MTNAEFYKDKIQSYRKNHSDFFCDHFIKEYIIEKDECGKIPCALCCSIVTLWLMEDYKEPEESEIDWENVPVDTPILVKNLEMDKWIKRHFARYENGVIYAWDGGRTSFSCTETVNWPYAKLWKGSKEQAAEKEAQCTD